MKIDWFEISKEFYEFEFCERCARRGCWIVQEEFLCGGCIDELLEEDGEDCS